MIPKELLDPEVLRLKGAHAGHHLIKYPFGVIALGDGQQRDPLADEQLFRDVPTALRVLKVRHRDCVPAKRDPERRYRVVATQQGKSARSAWVHSYMAAAMHVGVLEWQVRLDQGLLLPLEFEIEDRKTGSIAPPKLMSELGAIKDFVHAAPPSEGRPNYLVTLPEGAAAIWTGPDPKEEWWRDPQVMLHHYGLSEWPEATTEHQLPAYSIVKPDPKESIVVAEPYHSAIHAGRITCWLRQQSGIQCFVDDGLRVQGFDDTIMGGDVVRMTDTLVETYKVEVGGGVVALVSDQVLEVARPSPDSIN